MRKKDPPRKEEPALLPGELIFFSEAFSLVVRGMAGMMEREWVVAGGGCGSRKCIASASFSVSDWCFCGHRDVSSGRISLDEIEGISTCIMLLWIGKRGDGMGWGSSEKAVYMYMTGVMKRM